MVGIMVPCPVSFNFWAITPLQIAICGHRGPQNLQSEGHGGHSETNGTIGSTAAFFPDSLPFFRILIKQASITGS